MMTGPRVFAIAGSQPGPKRGDFSSNVIPGDHKPRVSIGRSFERMRIVDIRETAIPLKSQLKNSSFDFTEMTTSVVAVITDVKRDGKSVTGFAFNSTGRYACGA